MHRYTSLKLEEAIMERDIVWAVYRAANGYPEPRLAPGQYMLLATGRGAAPIASAQMAAGHVAVAASIDEEAYSLLSPEPPPRAGAIWPLGRSPSLSLSPGDKAAVIGLGGWALSAALLAAKLMHDGAEATLYTQPLPASIKERLWGAAPQPRLHTLPPGPEAVKAIPVEELRRASTVVVAAPRRLLCSLAPVMGSLPGTVYYHLDPGGSIRCGLGFCGRCLVPCTGKLLCRDGPVLPLGELGCWLRENC